MKKKELYIAPEINLYRLNTQNQILLGSNDGGMEEGGELTPFPDQLFPDLGSFSIL